MIYFYYNESFKQGSSNHNEYTAKLTRSHADNLIMTTQLASLLANIIQPTKGSQASPTGVANNLSHAVTLASAAKVVVARLPEQILAIQSQGSPTHHIRLPTSVQFPQPSNTQLAVIGANQQQAVLVNSNTGHKSGPLSSEQLIELTKSVSSAIAKNDTNGQSITVQVQSNARILSPNVFAATLLNGQDVSFTVKPENAAQLATLLKSGGINSTLTLSPDNFGKINVEVSNAKQPNIRVIASTLSPSNSNILPIVANALSAKGIAIVHGDKSLPDNINKQLPTLGTQNTISQVSLLSLKGNTLHTYSAASQAILKYPMPSGGHSPQPISQSLQQKLFSLPIPTTTVIADKPLVVPQAPATPARATLLGAEAPKSDHRKAPISNPLPAETVSTDSRLISNTPPKGSDVHLAIATLARTLLSQTGNTQKALTQLINLVEGRASTPSLPHDLIPNEVSDKTRGILKQVTSHLGGISANTPLNKVNNSLSPVGGDKTNQAPLNIASSPLQNDNQHLTPAKPLVTPLSVPTTADKTVSRGEAAPASDNNKNSRTPNEALRRTSIENMPSAERQRQSNDIIGSSPLNKSTTTADKFFASALSKLSTLINESATTVTQRALSSLVKNEVMNNPATMSSTSQPTEDANLHRHGKLSSEVQNVAQSKTAEQSSMKVAGSPILPNSTEATDTISTKVPQVTASSSATIETTLPARISALLNAPPILTTPIALTTPVAASNFVQGLVALLQLSLAGRALARQPSLKSQIDSPESIISKSLSSSGAAGTVSSSRVAQDIHQLDSRSSLFSTLKSLIANHQHSKIMQAESRIQGQDSYYYVLPSLAQHTDAPELLIQREPEPREQDSKNSQKNSLWNVTMKLDIGEVGQILAKSKISSETISVNLYTSNDTLLSRVADTLPFLKQRLSDLGLQVENMNFQRGSIPASLNKRPHHIFETKV